MSVTEVESALIALAATYPAICELITLPNPTFEGRTTHAVRLGTKPANTVDAYYLTGGVHAREWGSCEILVNLATDLCEAYSVGTGLGYGGKYYSQDHVRALMEQINVIVYPCVNPDGRSLSQTPVANGGVPMWRKNRNPASSGGDPAKIGVDINRNQDFLWNFNTAFAPGAINAFLASTDPVDDTYHGTAPASEPETQNINYIHNNYKIRWYVDVHSYSEDILYVWGVDEVQVTNPSQAFNNPAYDGTRGLIDGTYREFLSGADLATHLRLGNAFTRTLGEVRGTHYIAKPGFSLYATSGTNEDYAYSRHVVSPGTSKAISFTVEWGQELQPPWTEMEAIILDVTCGLLGLGLSALGLDSFIVTNRDTFSEAEVQVTPSYPEAFYVIVDGFSPNQLGLPAARPNIRFLTSIGGSNIAQIHATPASPILENPAALSTPQRVMFPFNVDFANTAPFNAETRVIFVESTIVGMTDVAPMRLLEQPNPYILDGPISWLSTDVRVFQLRPGQVLNGSNVVLGDPSVDPDAPYRYIRELLAELRSAGNAPAVAFEALPTGAQASELELSRTVGGERVFNYAVAKVRYRSNTQDAVDVRVFFRSFNTMVSDLSYTGTPGVQYVENYRRTPGGTIPLLGLNNQWSGAGNQIVSIPYFAQARVDSNTSSMAGQIDDTNKRSLAQAGAQEALQYFGCWLDFNQTTPQFPMSVPHNNNGPFSNRVSIVELVRGIHQCLVAEIRYQPGAVDPIGDGATPASSSRLAQRNLAIVESDNPGTAATHVVQHTLLVKPSELADNRIAMKAASDLPWERRYDELVIRWNDLPRETVATLYFPDWNADDVLAHAAEIGRDPSLLRRVDANTIECTVTDISYVPIPALPNGRSPGLLTLALPLGIQAGQEFTLDVQQHSGATLRRTRPMVRDQVESVGVGRGGSEFRLSARKVLGAFRLDVAVASGEPLLRKQVRNLAVLKLILKALPETDSWRPVFERYVAQLGKKVRELGIDPDSVPASADDPGLPGEGKSGANGFTGKVQEVAFDCFGEPETVVLGTCDGLARFRVTERRIADLAWRACRDRSLVTVYAADEPEAVIRAFVVHAL